LRLLLLLLALFGAAVPASADSIALSALRLDVDPAHWAVEVSAADQVTLRPANQPVGAGRTVRFFVRAADAACPVPPADVAGSILSGEPRREPGPPLGGVPTETILVYTRCRNLVYPATTICARRADHLYVVMSVPLSCRGGNLDPGALGTLLTGARFIE
jgi:hypothetical protein